MVRGPIERQRHLSFPGVTWDAAWSSGNLRGSGRSKCAILLHARVLRPQTAGSKELQVILNMGNRHRFPGRWKALKICQGVDIEPSVVSG